MRFNTDQKRSAAEVVNTYPRAELATIFKKYGEERWSERIAFFIVKKREKSPITTTTELVKVIKDAIPAAQRRSGGHPAKRTFQALRIEVNQELSALEQGLSSAVKCLKPGGAARFNFASEGNCGNFFTVIRKVIRRSFSIVANPTITTMNSSRPRNIPAVSAQSTPPGDL